MAATITATGTWTAVAPSKYTGGVGVQIGPTGAPLSPFDSRGATQAGLSGFPEFWQFVALMASNLNITTLEAMDILRLQLADARRQPAMGERAYAP
jgi:hypothetical protein